MRTTIILLGLAVIFLTAEVGECRARKTKRIALESKETNTVDFMRLLVMRLVFGFAAAMGLGDNLTGIFNGAFVPPGADDYDYGDESLVPDIF